MKRRKFIKLLGLSAAIPLAAACKPKPKETFEPYVPEEPKEEAFLYNGIKYPGKYEDYRTYLAEDIAWNSGLGKPDTLMLGPKTFKAWIDIVGKA